MKQNIITNLFDKNIEGKIIKINLDEISLLPELKNAFKMDEDVKNRIKLDMHITDLTKLIQFIFLGGRKNGSCAMDILVLLQLKNLN